MNIYILSQETENKLRQYIDEFKGILLVQQTLEWRDAILEMKSDEAFYIVAEDDTRIIGYMPLFIYRHKLGNILQSSPYPASYGGIITHLEGSEKELLFGKMFKFIFSQEGLLKNTILFTIVTSPFNNNLELYKKFFEYDYIKENYYQYIELTTMNVDSMNSKMRNKLKKNLAKAKQHQLQVAYSTELNAIEKMYDIIVDNFNHKGIEPISLSFYSALAKYIFPKDRGLLLQVMHDRTIVGSGFYVFNKSVVDLFAKGIRSEYSYTQAGTLCDYTALIYFQKNNFRFFNWQSSPKNDHGTFHYKAEWGSAVDYHYYLTKKLNNFESFHTSSLEEIKQSYRYHYVMPYEKIKL